MVSISEDDGYLGMSLYEMFSALSRLLYVDVLISVVLVSCSLNWSNYFVIARYNKWFVGFN